MSSSGALRNAFFLALAGLLAVSLVEFLAAPESPEITVPSGTILRIRLNVAEAPLVANEAEPVTGELAGPVVVHGKTVLPEGSHLLGVATELESDGKARSPRVSLRFTSLSLLDPSTRYPIETRSAVRDAALLLKRGSVVSVRLTRPLIVRAA